MRTERGTIKRMEWGMRLMKNKNLIVISFMFAILLAAGCLSTNSNPANDITKVDDTVSLLQNNSETKNTLIDTPQPKISDALKFCLEKYVYGKDGNWVNLAEGR